MVKGKRKDLKGKEGKKRGKSTKKMLVTLHFTFFLFSIANKSTVFYQEKNDLISTIELVHVLKRKTTN